jgi:hypothetical protein
MSPPKGIGAAGALYVVAVAMLPWQWFPPFPWLHQHAQWGDVASAAAFVAWGIERARERPAWRPSPFQLACCVYLAFSAASLFLGNPQWREGLPKLLGVGELVALAVMGSDLAERLSPWLARVVAANAVLVFAACVLGLVLNARGVETLLVGTYGELVPSPVYGRVEAGMFHPNLLANYCIFAAAVVAKRRDSLPKRLQSVARVALGVTVLLTFSRALLGFALAACWRCEGLRRRRWPLIALTVGSVLVVALLTRYNLVLDPTHPFAARLEDPVDWGRWLTLKPALTTMAHRPLFGCGLGRSPAEHDGVVFDAHLTPLNIAATLGLPALAAAAAVVVLAWRGRPRPTNVALWSGALGIALDALAGDVEDFRHVWVLLGLLAARASAPEPAQ